MYKVNKLKQFAKKFSLCYNYQNWVDKVQVPLHGQKGSTVKIRRSPAAVIDKVKRAVGSLKRMFITTG